MKQKISIVGGGVSALILACELDPTKYEVHVYEKNAAPGRKFLVAGDGGLNLTHSEAPAQFIQKYTPSQFLEKAFERFPNTEFIRWIKHLGINTYVGSSGRIFPVKQMKPIQVLNVILKRTLARGATWHTKHEWKGFTEDKHLLFSHRGAWSQINSHLVVFCVGGGSWPVTGSDGMWTDFFRAQGVHIVPFQASNCSFRISWPASLASSIGGKALKNCSVSCGNVTHKGEIVLTSKGVEGSGIYPLSPQIRIQLSQLGLATIYVDMKPSLSTTELLKKLDRDRGDIGYTNWISKQLNLSRPQVALLKQFIPKTDFLNTKSLVDHLKNFKLIITATGSVEDAISTTGGIGLEEIDSHFEFKKLPNHFAVGEMLDFDAPTGGYLIQSCFTMAKSLAEYLNHKD